MYSIDELRDCIGDPYFSVNERIQIYNPTVRDIRAYGETAYRFLVDVVTRKPYDVAVDLWDNGIDYSTITDYELFIDSIIVIPVEVSYILFCDLDFTRFVKEVDPQTNILRLVNIDDPDFIIDEPIYRKIVTYVRYTHFISEKVEYDMGNKTGRKFLIDRLRRKRKKLQKDIESGKVKPRSILFTMIRYCVNQPGFKYDYDSVMDLRYSLLQESYHQLQHTNERDIILFNVWNGKVDPSKIKNQDILQASADLHM